MDHLRTLLAVALAATVLSACSDDGGDDPVVDRTAAGESAGPSAAESPAAVATPSVSPSAVASPAAPQTLSAPAFPANTAVDTEEPTGGPLGVSAIRVARQQGFDRVVLQLGGKQAGQPGWRVEYVDEPTQDGSGDPVEVAGAAYLSVIVTGTGYPMDTGVEEPKTKRLAGRGTAVVKEVVLDGVFEGQTGAFIGVSKRLPFRVFRLADPARVVIDVRHR